MFYCYRKSLSVENGKVNSSKLSKRSEGLFVLINMLSDAILLLSLYFYCMLLLLSCYKTCVICPFVFINFQNTKGREGQ